MKESILSHLNDPGQLEKLYRANKSPFKQAFTTLYPEVMGNPLADFWHERLRSEGDEINWGTNNELVVVLLAVLLAGITAKLPALLGIDEEFFYPRNLSFILSPALIGYFAWRNKLPLRQLLFLAGATLAGLVFINLLPSSTKSDTLVLSCIHLALVQWAVISYSFSGRPENGGNNRLGYLKYNGDLAVMSALILIAGGITTGLTIGLFSLIGWDISAFYVEYIVVFGLPAVPILGTYLTQNNPQLVGRVSHVIARLFSPLVLVMLLVYLVAILYAGKNPYQDREFLLLFNALLIGVLALIFFSIAETSDTPKSRLELWGIFLLSILTILINCVALSAILFRISEWGFTPNRTVVLGSNGLILLNLLLVTRQLFRVITQRSSLDEVGKTIAAYLPVYYGWVTLVTFVFPFLFKFR